MSFTFSGDPLIGAVFIGTALPLYHSLQGVRPRISPKTYLIYSLLSFFISILFMSVGFLANQALRAVSHSDRLTILLLYSLLYILCMFFIIALLRRMSVLTDEQSRSLTKKLGSGDE